MHCGKLIHEREHVSHAQLVERSRRRSRPILSGGRNTPTTIELVEKREVASYVGIEAFARPLAKHALILAVDNAMAHTAL